MITHDTGPRWNARIAVMLAPALLSVALAGCGTSTRHEASSTSGDAAPGTGAMSDSGAPAPQEPPSGTAAQPEQPDAPSGTAEDAEAKALHDMFELTVPSIEAALPLAVRADSVVKNADERFEAIGWFSDGQPVCMKINLIQAGDTTGMDRYYYQRGRLIAWAKELHWRKGDPGFPHRVSSRVVYGPGAKPRYVRMTRDGEPMPMNSSAVTTIMGMSEQMEAGLIAILARKARASGRS